MTSMDWNPHNSCYYTDSFVHELMMTNHPGGRDLRQLDVIMDDTADSIALISVLCAILMHAADV